MTKRSRPRFHPAVTPLATLLESRPGVPRAIHEDSVDVDDLPGVHTSPVHHSSVLASVDAQAPRIRDPETRPARRQLARNLMELAVLLESRTDYTKPPARDSVSMDPRRAEKRARLERAAREAGERIKKRAQRR